MVTRPVILIPVWGFCALGYKAAKNSAIPSGFYDCWKSVTFTDYFDIAVFSLAVAAVYIMNQLADIEVDKKNGGLPLIASGIVSIKSAIAIMGLCGSISLLYPLLQYKFELFVAALSTMILGYVYSFKPLRLSGRPILDFLSNAFGYGIIAFAVGWYCSEHSYLSHKFIAAALPYFFLMSSGSISSTIPDISGDKEDSKNTTAVVFGASWAHSLALFFLLTAAIAGVWQHDLIPLICSGASLPFYIGYYVKKTPFFIESTYKIGGGISMLAAFIAYPYFLLLSVVVFLATWLYFRIRHGISYPSLSSAQT